MSVEKIQIAVLKDAELRIPSFAVARELMARGFLVEGWEEHHTIYYGVAREYTLEDVEREIQSLEQRGALLLSAPGV